MTSRSTEHGPGDGLTLGDLAPRELAERCRAGGLVLDLGPFWLRLSCDIAAVWDTLRRVYADVPVLPPASLADFTFELRRPLARRWVRPQVRLWVDGEPLFLPLPLRLAPVLIEWGMNWVVSLRAHRFLLVHASVVARGGAAAILPAKPGSGKSTLGGLLCAAGWRLLSDEFALIRPGDGKVEPFPRPISLKAGSIDAVLAVAPDLQTTGVFDHPEDGPMVLVRPPGDAVRARGEAATPKWVVFPTYEPSAALSVARVSKTDAFFEMQDDTFNYFVLGAAGFKTLARVVESSDCLRLTYSRTDEVLAFFDDLAAEGHQP